MNPYHKEQSDTFTMIQQEFAVLPSTEKQKLKAMAEDYLIFRDEVDAFLASHFGEVCTHKCYQSQLSACCSREGIITFFGDTAVNVLMSGNEEIEILIKTLQKPDNGFKCIYLGQEGCMWRVKPIVCEMFLCDQAKKEVFDKKPELGQIWENLNLKKKHYTWPDKPVLFDALENFFINRGLSSPLMYMHNSPGLLRVKQRAGVI
ncbi:MAG: hypothetical protein GY795_29920 [Desulfobacterales bacterium]|nr:hypothetical protein [Desulfobacterales bacterium]